MSYAWIVVSSITPGELIIIGLLVYGLVRRR